ncbi:hypothetical protein B0H11DRAFT_1901470 [Mycena galericulata]|nr:hypothetical protein B0H11DRAFT_1901470 [Mycena galericulata]
MPPVRPSKVGKRYLLTIIQNAVYVVGTDHNDPWSVGARAQVNPEHTTHLNPCQPLCEKADIRKRTWSDYIGAAASSPPPRSPPPGSPFPALQFAASAGSTNLCAMPLIGVLLRERIYMKHVTGAISWAGMTCSEGLGPY